MPSVRTVFAATAVALALAGCGVGPGGGDGLVYRAPAARGALPAVTLPGTSASESLAAAAVRLRAAGFTEVRTDGRGVRVTARSGDPELVDCGSFVQTALGNTARFPGNAPRAVLFVPDAPGGIVTRETTVATRVTVALDGPGRARVTTTHEVRATQAQVVGARGGAPATIRFDGDATGVLPDQVTCTGSDRIVSILAGG
jgi:hypothetical protein